MIHILGFSYVIRKSYEVSFQGLLIEYLKILMIWENLIELGIVPLQRNNTCRHYQKTTSLLLLGDENVLVRFPIKRKKMSNFVGENTAYLLHLRPLPITQPFPKRFNYLRIKTCSFHFSK